MEVEIEWNLVYVEQPNVDQASEDSVCWENNLLLSSDSKISYIKDLMNLSWQNWFLELCEACGRQLGWGICMEFKINYFEMSSKRIVKEVSRRNKKERWEDSMSG